MYYSAGTYEAFARPEKPEGADRKSAYIIGTGLAGLSAAGGQFTITAAYTRAPAREVSVFDYTQIVFAAGLGFLFFGQLPDILSVIGYCIISGVAIWMFLYNLRKDHHLQQ